MKYIIGTCKTASTAAIISAILFASIPVSGQELVSHSDIAGGSSVFIFRNSSKAAPRKFVSKSRAVRTKSQRIETARKVGKQYTTLAKVKPRRTRTDVVDPNDQRLKQISRMEPGPASKLFAGVGEYYMDRDNFDQAIDFFRESLDLNASYEVAKSGLSEALALKGNTELIRDMFGPARRLFEEALTYNPNNAPARYGLAEVYSSEGKDAEALANYEKALANDKELTEIFVPLGILYYQKGEIAKADEMFGRATTISATDAEAQYYLGLIRHSQGHDQEALAAFRKAKAADPSYAEAFFQTGESLIRLKKPEEAITEYKRATELKPAYFEAWLGLGNANYETSKWQAAVTAYKEAVRLRNNNAEAFENLGDAYRQIPDFQNAESNYKLAALFIERSGDFSREQAADIYSKSAFMVAKQCELNRQRGLKCRWDDAITYLEKGMKYSQADVDNSNLGWVYYNAAKEDLITNKEAAAKIKLAKAKTALQKAVSSGSSVAAGPLVNLGMALSDMGDYNGAIDSFNKAIQKEPKWTFALNELGIVYRKQQKFKEAAAQFRKAVDKDDKFVVAHYNLGEAEFRNGNMKEVKKAYQKLKKHGAEDLAKRLDVLTGGAVRN